MAIPITVPRLGWNMEEGKFAGWLHADGTVVRAGDPLFSLESDKSTEEVEALDPGLLRIPPNGPRVGDVLAVGTVIGYLIEAGEPVPWEADSAPMASVKPAVSHATAPSIQPPTPLTHPTSSPRARRVAVELGIDWHRVQGTGRAGRVRERDIRVAAAQLDGAATSQDTIIPLTNIRRSIAERLVQSRQATVPVTLTTTVDATNLVNLRRQFQASASQVPIPSYTDFLVKLTAAALQTHPSLRARWSNEGLIVPIAIHIGIAVDTPAGLLVPVIRDVPALGLRQVAERSRTLIERARQGKLAAAEMEDGTFTVTNLGSFGIDAFTPIINFPECAVLGIGRIQRRPAVAGEQIIIRDEITLSLTFDHRIVDGAPAARFLQTLSGLIENPGPALVS